MRVSRRSAQSALRRGERGGPGSDHGNAAGQLDVGIDPGVLRAGRAARHLLVHLPALPKNSLLRGLYIARLAGVLTQRASSSRSHAELSAPAISATAASNTGVVAMRCVM